MRRAGPVGPGARTFRVRPARWAFGVAIVLLLTAVPIGASAAPTPASLPAYGLGGGALPVSGPANVPPPSGNGTNHTTFLESGRGSFFTNTVVPNGTSSFPSCTTVTYAFGGSTRSCYNASVDPTLNLTSRGVTGLAFTSYTNDSPCASMRGNATTEIGFVTSTDFGTHWGTPKYLGNPICGPSGSNDLNYSDAVEPALTSLSNGTFALAYVEFNITNGTNYYNTVFPLSTSCEWTLHNRVVVTESYDNGSTWTTPHVLNETDRAVRGSSTCQVPGIPLLRPSIAAIGDTIYVAWMAYPHVNAVCCSHSLYNGTLGLSVSTDAGVNWTNGSIPPTIRGTIGSPVSAIAAYPDLLVTPAGRLYFSYATAFDTQFSCKPASYCGDIYNATLVVGFSTDNGTSFNISEVTQSAGMMDPYMYLSPALTDPLSALAYDAVHHSVDIVFASGQPGSYCDQYSPNSIYCGAQTDLDNVFFSSSANGGHSWTRPVRVAPTLSGPQQNSTYNILGRPSIGVDASGTLDVTFLYENDSVCGPYVCGGAQEAYVNSTDGGKTWSPPTIVDGNFSFFDCSTCVDQWQGTSTATLAVGGQVLLAWPKYVAPVSTYSYWGGGPASEELVSSRLFTGAGLDISFNESGLPAGAVWSINVGGYGRDGPAGANLSISGVPPSLSLPYTAPWVNYSGGIAYSPTFTPVSPTSFTASGSVSVVYVENVLVSENAIPSLPSYYWQYAYTNYAISPGIGSYWVTVGSSITFSVTPQTPLYCYPCVNLTFLTWTGTGAGALASSALSITLYPTGPVDETASFSATGYCYGSSTGCTTFTYLQQFSEVGLPTGTAWGVTMLSSNGSASTVSGTSAGLSVGVSGGLVDFQAWTVPAGTSGQYWVPEASVASPLFVPSTTVTITYVLASVGSAASNALVRETGLPNGTSWSFDVGGAQTGAAGVTASVPITPGGASLLSGAPVYFENGTGFYVAHIVVSPLSANSTNTTVDSGTSASFNASALLTFEYSPSYLVSPSATVGGNVSAPGQWIDAGASLVLTAEPSNGYHFASWTGVGSGSVSSGTSVQITVRPYGPVSELATFRANFPPTWNVTLTSSGLPAGSAFSVNLGGITYTGTHPVVIGNFSTGSYDVAALVVEANVSNTTRYVPTGVSSTSGLSGNVLDLTQNVTLTASYETQYALSVFATPGGNITGYPDGVYWENASDLVGLTAAPDPGYEFAGWSGTVTSLSPTISVAISGVSNETAQFLPTPPRIPATFTLQVTETGLPAGTAWSFTLGTTGAAGASSTLTVPGLNGTYSLTAAPVFPSVGVRYLPTSSGVATAVASNSSATVTYFPQYLLSISASAGGIVSASTQWVNASASITLTATPNDTSTVFLGWSGTGPASVNSTAATIVVPVDGPTTEVATFGAPHASTAPSSGGGSTNGLGTTILALVLLAIVGLAVGLLLGRRRPPAGAGPIAEVTPEDADTYPADATYGMPPGPEANGETEEAPPVEFPEYYESPPDPQP